MHVIGDAVLLCKNSESIPFTNFSVDHSEEDLFTSHDSQRSTDSVDPFVTETFAAELQFNSTASEAIASHLILATLYMIFHGPLAVPPDVDVGTNTISQTLYNLAPSLFDVEYLKVC
jgi:hypothetical protein